MIITNMEGDILSVHMEFSNNSIIYHSIAYNDICKFFAELANLSDSLIVLKKI